jgi:hypothetical protein
MNAFSGKPLLDWLTAIAVELETSQRHQWFSIFATFDEWQSKILGIFIQEVRAIRNEIRTEIYCLKTSTSTEGTIKSTPDIQ